MKVHISLIPPESIEEYDAMKYVDNDGYVYVEVAVAVAVAMYGLAQSGWIAN